MKWAGNIPGILLSGFLLRALSASSGTLSGFVKDPNWFARYGTGSPGVGYYEYGVFATAEGDQGGAGADDTDVFGAFSMNSLGAASYTVVSWDVWWRSAFAFGVDVPSLGNSSEVDLRLNATMWGYPAFWDDSSYPEHGQTFVATGPVTMIYLRNPLEDVTYQVTVHEGGPGGVKIGQTRTFNQRGDHRLIYGFGQMPTVAGQLYYVCIRVTSGGGGGILRQMDPRPDFSDPMPGGSLWLGAIGDVTAYPDRDLGLIIMADDDGLLTNLSARRSGSDFNSVTQVGQTFVARGVHLISAAFWLADAANPTYLVRVRQTGPGGAQVGPAKRGKVARLTADPQMIVAWAPGECPLVSGQTYYLEVTRDDGAMFHSVHVNRANPFPYGQAYQNGLAVSGTDLAGTIMEESFPGSVLQPEVSFGIYPGITEANRGTNHLTIQWNTDVPADSLIEFAAGYPPYTESLYHPSSIVSHSVTLSNLTSHTPIHYRVISSAAGYRPAVSRDQTVVTRPSSINLLSNPGFEEGTGGSPRSEILGWEKAGGLDIKTSDGSWFGGIPPHGGGWLLQGAISGSGADAAIYQKVADLAVGENYTFSAWTTTWMRENGQFKYDVWNDPGRLSYMQLGLDPTGGTDPDGATVEWTPRFYSHLTYCNPALSTLAQRSEMTAFVRMRGQGGDWHLYGVDDCVLTEAPFEPVRLQIEWQDSSTIILTWPGGGWTLQMAQIALGRWVTLTGAESPTLIHVPTRAQSRFFRLVR